MIGMLSLVDVLVQQPKAEVIASLPMDDSLKEAVLEGRHVLGELLRWPNRWRTRRRIRKDTTRKCCCGETQALDWVNSMWK
jgi:EAL and modified HD-GYP domain-containing signal transduction protein